MPTSSMGYCTAAVWPYHSHPRNTQLQQAEGLASALADEFGGNLPGRLLYLKSLLGELLIQIYRWRITRQEKGLTNQRRTLGWNQDPVSAVIEYVDENIASRLSLARIARAFHVTPEHSSRPFRQQTGMTVGQFLRLRRISMAKQLVKETNQQITDIAVACGFASLPHFSRVFKEITGMTPTEFRSSSLDGQQKEKVAKPEK